jgi:hypothetical protein
MLEATGGGGVLKPKDGQVTYGWGEQPETDGELKYGIDKCTEFAFLVTDSTQTDMSATCNDVMTQAGCVLWGGGQLNQSEYA